MKTNNIGPVAKAVARMKSVSLEHCWAIPSRNALMEAVRETLIKAAKGKANDS